MQNMPSKELHNIESSGVLKITKQNLLLMGQKKWSYTDKFQFIKLK